MLAGEGRSTKVELIILIRGWFLRNEIVKWNIIPISNYKLEVMILTNLTISGYLSSQPTLLRLAHFIL